jgi:hypothetical protein
MSRTKRRWRAVLAAGLVGVLVVACSGGGDGGEDRAGTRQDEGPADDTPGEPDDVPITSDKAAWTFLVYFAADNNLEGAAMRDLLELIEVGSSPDVNLVAFVDRAPGFDEEPVANLPAFETAKIVRADEGALTEVGDFGEVDSGDPQTLAWFLDQSIQAFPADHYAAVLWDHGAGWTSFGEDASSSSDMNLAEVRDGIAAGVAGLDGKLDLLAFDACLMATYEVAAAVEPFAELLVASEELVPNDGFDYLSLGALRQAPAMTGDQLSETLVAAFATWYTQTAPDPTVTLSTIDLRQLGRLRQALGGFAMAVTESITDVAAPLGRARSDATTFGDTPDFSFGLVDLGDVSRRLVEDIPDAVAVARASLFEAVDGAVINSFAGEGHSSATGVSIYFPRDSLALDPAYEQIPGTGAWRELLDAYYDTARDPAGGVPAFLSTALDYAVDATGVLGAAALAPGTEAAVTDVTAQGILLGDVATVLVEFPGVLSTDDSGTNAVASWGFGYFELADAAGSFPMSTILYPYDETTVAATGLAIYETPDGTQTQAIVDMIVDFDTGAVEVFGLYAATDGGYAELFVEPGAVVYPALFQRSATGDGEVVAGPVALDPSTLGATLQVLSGGSDFAFVVQALDAAGNVVEASATDVVP